MFEGLGFRMAVQCIISPHPPAVGPTSHAMRVNRSDLDAFADRSETSALVTPEFASCLRLISPNLTLSYPSDAEAHFIELQNELAEFWTWRPMRSQPGGPAYVGLEDAWHMHFSTLYKAARGGSLPHIFGPYILLFICWYCQPRVFDVKLVPTLRRVLRPSVLYITVRSLTAFRAPARRTPTRRGHCFTRHGSHPS